MKNKTRIGFALSLCLVLVEPGCIHYSMTGAATSAKTINIEQFFNNTDMAPANLAQDFTNKVKDYYQQNSSLRVVPENGELQLEGVFSEYSLRPMAPTGNNTSTPAATTNTAALTRLTISIKVSYVDSTEPKNSFKDRTFSFYSDFDNNLNFTTVQEDLQKKIFDQILIDLFNATVANW